VGLEFQHPQVAVALELERNPNWDKFAATTGVSVPAALIPTVTGNPAVKARVATSPSGALEYLALNTKRPASANPEVRKAIEYASTSRPCRSPRVDPSTAVRSRAR